MPYADDDDSQAQSPGSEGGRELTREELAEKERLTDLILELSLTAALPLNLTGIDEFRGAAATKSLAYRTEHMGPKELRELEYTIGPLLGLLSSDVNSPLAAPASTGLRNLLGSYRCIVRFVELDGAHMTGRLMDQLLSGKAMALKTPSASRTIVENLALCYRELARWYPQQIVRAGCIRHCVRMMQYGDMSIKAVSVSVLSTLSDDLEVVKKMFTSGAIKPLLRLCDIDNSTPACLLAALGCVLQFARIPEIGIRLMGQGALAVLEGALHHESPLARDSIREKALMSVAWLTKIDSIKSRLATPAVLDAMKRELLGGRQLCQVTVTQMMLNLRYAYPEEVAFNTSVRDKILELLASGPWTGRNVIAKLCVLLYRDDDNKLYFVQNGAFESIFDLIYSKSLDLQEVPMVCLLFYCTHPDVPPIFMEKGGLQVLVRVLYAIDENIRDMAVVLLKALCLYDRPRVVAIIPADRAHLFAPDPNADPVVYGSEYGHMIQDYLQHILKNRREHHYLLEQFSPGEVDELAISAEELQAYQTTFMLLDVSALGYLEMDELKVIMVIMGEKLDAEEMQLLLDEYDTEKTGRLNFKQFSLMMKGWKTRFGTGATKVYNETLQRGAIGKGRRAFSAWWNKDKIAKAEIEKLKADRAAEKEKRQKQMEKYMGGEKIRKQRELEQALKAQELAEINMGGDYDDDDEY